jgi:hypothetical protein
MTNMSCWYGMTWIGQKRDVPCFVDEDNDKITR